MYWQLWTNTKYHTKIWSFHSKNGRTFRSTIRNPEARTIMSLLLRKRHVHTAARLLGLKSLQFILGTPSRLYETHGIWKIKGCQFPERLFSETVECAGTRPLFGYLHYSCPCGHLTLQHPLPSRASARTFSSWLGIMVPSIVCMFS